MKIIKLLFLLLPLQLMAEQTQSTFVIDIYDDFVRVVSPNKITPKMQAIVNNRTLTKIYGYIQSPDSSWKSYFTLKSEKTKALPLKGNEFKQFILYSQAPPFQEVWLKPGMKVYEIPPQKNRQ